MLRIIAGMLLFFAPFAGKAQIGGLLNKAKNKVNQRIDNRVDREMDKALDKAEGKPGSHTPSGGESVAEAAPEKKVESFSKFDFIPGERVLYAEDFSQDQVGELPLTWNSSGKGEVMTLKGHPGKWLRAFGNNTYLSGNTAKLGENYTIEFDLMYYFEAEKKGYVLPAWHFGMFSSGELEGGDNAFLQERSKWNCTTVKMGYGSYAHAKVETRVNNTQTFVSNTMELGDPWSYFNRVIHYSVQVQKTRLRVWMGARKIFDVPRALVANSDTLNQFFFKLESSGVPEHELGLFISNIKIATGIPDMRHKLMEEGKFSTTGILFDVNQATIRPESSGVLKEIAEVLKANSGVRVKIIGHTDSDGADAANLELSKKRAEAVRTALVSEYGIDESAITTDGKGEGQPVGDNKTREGKAQNRRVEFIKL